MSKSLPRGTHSHTPPSRRVGNPTHLCEREPVFGSEFSLNPSGAIFCTMSYFYCLLSGYFVRNGLLTILHRSVFAHIHLIISMCCPPQIVKSVIARIPVTMGNICQRLIEGLSEKSDRHKAVPKSPNGLSCCVSQNICNIPERRDGSTERNGRSFPSKSFVWVSPLSRLFSPRTDLSVLVDFVMFKPRDSFPSIHRTI